MSLQMQPYSTAKITASSGWLLRGTKDHVSDVESQPLRYEQPSLVGWPAGLHILKCYEQLNIKLVMVTLMINFYS